MSAADICFSSNKRFLMSSLVAGVIASGSICDSRGDCGSEVSPRACSEHVEPMSGSGVAASFGNVGRCSIVPMSRMSLHAPVVIHWDFRPMSAEGSDVPFYASGVMIEYTALPSAYSNAS
ncbi:Hypothetical predicted protein [Pelobates cultripes]|uniref:Uncharacterized protein n=1 Tax=Pelobates cultripes TaxID=61616 RepID=A0AAD1VXF6_PELCU|nr:Hypothetical predicted protein [Pelobates cultripes]